MATDCRFTWFNCGTRGHRRDLSLPIAGVGGPPADADGAADARVVRKALSAKQRKAVMKQVWQALDICNAL